MIDLAKTNLQIEDANIELFHINGINLPFGNNRIDTTVVVTVLMHNKDRESVRRMVAEICRLTKTKVFIIEGTSRKVNTHFSHEKRPIEIYEKYFRENGFAMSSREYLDTELSRICCGALDRIFFATQRGKGTPMSVISGSVQAMLIPITKHTDKVIKRKRGLTKMVFVEK